MAEPNPLKNRFASIAKTAAPVLIFGTIYIAWNYATRTLRPRKPKVVLTRSRTFGMLHGGHLALQRLVDYNTAQANPATLDKADKVLKALLEEEHPDFKKLQNIVAKLEMSRKEDDAVNVLTNALKKARKENKFHEAYEIEMLLLEMLIYKGDFDKAWTCDCLKHEEITDARRPLYKAILHLLTDQSKEAAERYWKEFNSVQRQHAPLSSTQECSVEQIADFGGFEKAVNSLKDAIRKQLALKKHKPRI